MIMQEMKFNSIGKEMKISVEDKNRYLLQCIKVENCLIDVLNEVRNFRESKSTGMDEGFNLLMKTEEILGLDVSGVREMQKKYMASTPSLRRRTISFVLCFDLLRSKIDDAVTPFVPYSTEELESLEKVLKQCSGHLACFVLYQFGFNNLLKNDEELVMLDVLDFYIRTSNLSRDGVKELAEHLKSIMRECNPSMGVFEMYPDLLEPFSELVEEDIYDAEILDIQTVMKVVSGEMSIETFKILLEDLYEKESLSE